MSNYHALWSKNKNIFGYIKQSSLMEMVTKKKEELILYTIAYNYKTF